MSRPGHHPRPDRLGDPRELQETLRERRKTVDALLDLRRGLQREPAASIPGKTPNMSPEPVLKRYENE
jgi:hypothetical protein